MRLFVGNIGYGATDQDVADFFKEAGVTVRTVKLIRDRETGDSRGFCFVEVDGEAEAAIEKTDGVLMRGRPLKVQAAKEQGRREGNLDGDTYRRRDRSSSRRRRSRDRDFDEAWREDSSRGRRRRF